MQALHPLTFLAAFATGFAALAFALAPVGIEAEIWQGPAWLLIAFGFWAARRPEAAPPAMVFAIGLAHDLLRDGPVGAETFALLVTIELLRMVGDRSPARGFVIEWLRFAAAALLFEMIVQGLFAVTLTPSPSLSAMVERYVVTVALYAPATLLLQKLSRITRRPPSVY